MDWYKALDVAQKCSVIVAVAGYLLQRRSIALQHQRARLEKATAIVGEYARSLTPRSAAARKLAKHLTLHQIDALENGREFQVDVTHRDLLVAALPGEFSDEQLRAENAIILTCLQSFLLRWEIIARLNSCEVVAQCWLTDVADKKTIEDELRFLLEHELGQNILTVFRSIANPQNYPAISALIQELEDQRTPKQRPTKIDRSALDRLVAWLTKR